MLLHLLDPREKTAIEPLPPALALAGGVFELPSEGGAKLDGRGEVGAGFADGFKGAVEFNRSCAVAVTQHAMVLSAQAAHDRAFSVGRKRRLVVESFDLLADGEVLVGHSPIG